MKPIIEALLDLNKSLMLSGYDSDYTITLRPDDFHRFYGEFKDMRGFDSDSNVTWIKIAGPGSYFHILKQV